VTHECKLSVETWQNCKLSVETGDKIVSCQWKQMIQYCKLSVETDDKTASCQWTHVAQDCHRHLVITNAHVEFHHGSVCYTHVQKCRQMLILHNPLIFGAKCSFDKHWLPFVDLVTCDRSLAGSVAVKYWQVSAPRADRGRTVS
jgi:hypothetical protein